MNSTSGAPVTPERIMQFSWGYTAPLILEAGIKHRVFDVLDSGAKTLDQVQQETGASARGLASIMNALVGLGFLSKSDGAYSLTEESSTFLVSTKPSFHGGILRHCSEDLIPNWLKIDEVVASGKPVTSVNQEGDGGAFFEKFVTDILPLSYPAARTLASHLNIAAGQSGVTGLDIAAGSGVWGIALAQSAANLQMTAVDWPNVLPVTKKTAERFGVADRFSYISGDLMEVDYGTGYTIATLGHILHSEGEQRSRDLLKKVFSALAPGGTIAIAEFLVNADRTGPPMGLLFAVNMLVNTEKGDTFSFEEISSWLQEAGFVDARTLDAPGPSPLILATKPA